MSTLATVKPVTQVLAVGAFSAAAVFRPPAVSASLAVAGILLVVAGSIGERPVASRLAAEVAGVVAALVVLVSRYNSVGPLPSSTQAIRPIWTALVIVASASLLLVSRGGFYRGLAVIAATTAVVSITIAVTVGEWESERGFDVYKSHQLAGEALLDGENPYGDAVQTPNGSPHAPEGAVIVGYVYPPVVVGTYGLMAAIADPRVVSTVTWLAFLGFMAWGAFGKARPNRNVAAGLFVVLATAPVWPVVWFASWTEPLSLALLVAAAVLWRSKPVPSAVLLGLALASKQYFVFLAPLVLLHKSDRSLQRSLVALGTAAMTIVPALLVDPSAYVMATIGNLTDIGFRPDTQSISGLLARFGVEVILPIWLWALLGLVVATVVARLVTTPGEFITGAALILAVVFVTGQAFPNYWFLVMGLVAAAPIVSGMDRSDEGTTEVVAVLTARPRPG